MRTLPLILLLVFAITFAPVLLGQSFMVKNYDLLGGVFINRGDFNHDGILDLVTTSFEPGGSSFSISVFLGRPDGTFQDPVLSPLPLQPNDLALGDFNHDGNLDVATVGIASNGVMVMLGNGDGTFGPARVLETTTAIAPKSITAGDFNGDGNLDIAVGSGNPAEEGQRFPDVINEPNTVSIFPGDGTGNFGTPVKFAGFGTTPLERIRVADFNSDGKHDIAVITDTEAIALLGQGQFQFTPNLLATYFDTGDVTPVDVNQDGFTDLLVSYVSCNDTCSLLDVFLSTGPNHALQKTATITVATASSGSGGFRGSAVIAAGQPTAVDINGDGINDIVANVRIAGHFETVSAWLGNPDGTFQSQPQNWVLESEGLDSLVAGDFNRDGKIDIAITNVTYSWLSVLLNSAPKADCNVSTQPSTVTMCTPQNLAYSNSPVRVTAFSSPEPPAFAGQIYVDNSLAYEMSGTQIDATLDMSPGDHFVVAKFWDTNGSTSLTGHYISVFDGPPGETCPTSPQAMTMCAPATNGTFASPLHVFAAVQANAPVTAFQVYIDDQLVNNDVMHDTYIDTAFPLAPGPHRVVVQAFDGNGVVYQSARDVLIQ